jgi:hypothetical protein
MLFVLRVFVCKVLYCPRPVHSKYRTSSCGSASGDYTGKTRHRVSSLGLTDNVGSHSKQQQVGQRPSTICQGHDTQLFHNQVFDLKSTHECFYKLHRKMHTLPPVRLPPTGGYGNHMMQLKQLKRTRVSPLHPHPLLDVCLYWSGDSTSIVRGRGWQLHMWTFPERTDGHGFYLWLPASFCDNGPLRKLTFQWAARDMMCSSQQQLVGRRRCQ